jgi:hypothetical protein
MMRSITATFFLLSFTLCYGQKQALDPERHGVFDRSFSKTITDTIDSHFVHATPVLYPSPTGGFVSGNTGFGENARVQEFFVRNPGYTIEGFLFWFGHKEQTSLPADSSMLIFVFQDMDSAGTIYDSNRVIPRTIWEADTVFFNTIDTSSVFSQGLYFWDIPPKFVNRNYVAGVRFDLLAPGDTIALWSSTDGDPPRTAQAWEFWLNAWRPMLYTWGLHVDLAIFPLINFSTSVSEHEGDFVNPIIAPNPVAESWEILFPDVSTSQTAIRVLDASGRLLFEDTLEPSKKSKRYDAELLSQGLNFVLFIEAGKPVYAVKVIR